LATLLPLDKAKNAERVRRVVVPTSQDSSRRNVGIAPHLRALMFEYAATGLPPGFVPKEDTSPTDDPIDPSKEPQ
jgi:hypothetical protein